MPHTHRDAGRESAPLLGLQPQFPVVYLLLLRETRELRMEGQTVLLGYPEKERLPDQYFLRDSQ